jgi:hypothetical protein
MELLETNVTPTTVRMRYADNPDPAKAKVWLDFQVPVADLKRRSETELGDPERRLLAEVRLTALRYARDVIAAETRRLSDLLDRSGQ